MLCDLRLLRLLQLLFSLEKTPKILKTKPNTACNCLTRITAEKLHIKSSARYQSNHAFTTA